MENEKRIKQIDWSIIGVIVIIFVLIHSIYLLMSEKKGLLGEETLNDEDFIKQAIYNRITASVVILMFLIFQISNLKDKLNSDDSTEEAIQDNAYRIIVSGLALLATLIEVYLGFRNYILIKENES